MIKPYYETELGKLYHGNCIDILSQLDEKVDLTLTDPPYGMGSILKVRGHGLKAIERGSLANWDKNFEPSSIPWPDCGLVAFTLDWRIPQWYALKSTGRILIWHKTNATPSLRKQFVNAAEFIFCDAKFYYRTHRNSQTVLSGPFDTNPYRPHPCKKPDWLIRELIGMFSLPNHLLLDPFLGSGTTAIACERLDRRWIGIEISKEYCDIAVERIEQERSQLKLI
ncbi:MAG: site-specific DNA-methyltransferase [Deltaproteobacteria bacterium]|nr:site-specific DNA-methyltransferase [Deltaproteobacteria bacterium]